jgi:membrane protein implicated in regulation of membrane protease activity
VIGKASQRTFARYVAFQVPGWMLAACAAWWLAAEADLAPWIAALGWGLFVIKDFALYPWVRDSYAVGEPAASALLVGRTGVVRDRIEPSGSGYVRIGAELWRAELAPGCAAVDAGASVRVHEVRGLTLIVQSC